MGPGFRRECGFFGAIFSEQNRCVARNDRRFGGATPCPAFLPISVSCFLTSRFSTAFDAAARAGFTAVEYASPYEYPARSCAPG